MRKSPHFLILILVICRVSQIVVPLYYKQPSKPKKGLIVRLKDSSAKWKVTLENRNNETVYSGTTNGLFSELHFSEQFRVKMFGEAVGFFRNFLMQFHPKLVKFSENRHFLKIRFYDF